MPIILDWDDDIVLERISIVMGTCSLAGCIVVILNFLIHEKLRTFCFKMVHIRIYTTTFTKYPQIIDMHARNLSVILLSIHNNGSCQISDTVRSAS